MDKKLIYTNLFFSLFLIVFCNQASEMVELSGSYKVIKNIQKVSGEQSFEYVYDDVGIVINKDKEPNGLLICRIRCLENGKYVEKAFYHRKANLNVETRGFSFNHDDWPFKVPKSFLDAVNKKQLPQGEPSSEQKKAMEQKIVKYNELKKKIQNNSEHNKAGKIGDFGLFINAQHLKIAAQEDQGILFINVPKHADCFFNSIDQCFTYAYLFARGINYRCSANNIISSMTREKISEAISLKIDHNNSVDVYINLLKTWKNLYESNKKVSMDSAEENERLFLISNSIVVLTLHNNCLGQDSDFMGLFVHVNQLKIATTYAFVLMIKNGADVFQCLVNKNGKSIEIVTGQRITDEIRLIITNILGARDDRDFLAKEIIKLELPDQHPKCIEGLAEELGILKVLVETVLKKKQNDIKTDNDSKTDNATLIITQESDKKDIKKKADDKPNFIEHKKKIMKLIEKHPVAAKVIGGTVVGLMSILFLKYLFS
jgi:hypothetical protein